MCDFGRGISLDFRKIDSWIFLGFAKKIDRSKAYTLCGTPEFLAPEIMRVFGNYSIPWIAGISP